MRSYLKRIIFDRLGAKYIYLILINIKHGLRLPLKANSDGIHILREVFTKKVYNRYFPEGRKAVIVDIGAHYGFFSLYACLNTMAGSRIIAIEPSPHNVGIMENNLQASCTNITIVKAAVSDQDGIGYLSLENPQNHSLYNGRPSKAGTPQYIEVRTLSLSSLLRMEQIEKVDFLKMDCEGGEYRIIMGMEDCDLEKIEVISMELHDRTKEGYTPEMIIERLSHAGLHPANPRPEFKAGFNHVLDFIRNNRESTF